MGIFTKLATTWKSMTTKDKIGLVIDVISGVGCGLGSMIVGSKLSEGQGRIKGACIKPLWRASGWRRATYPAKP